MNNVAATGRMVLEGEVVDAFKRRLCSRGREGAGFVG